MCGRSGYGLAGKCMPLVGDRDKLNIFMQAVFGAVTMNRGQHRCVLIAGPTASGKSALALALAERIGGIVVNADSMQMYGDLRIITARPTPSEETRVPH